MADQFRTLIQDISTVIVPQLTFDRCVISRQKFDNTNQIDFLIDDLRESIKNQLNFKFKFLLNDKIDLIEKNGYWYNNKVISKFLKFKTVFCISKKEEETLISDLRKADSFNKSRVHTFSFEDFKSRTSLNFSSKKSSNKQIIGNFFIDFENSVFEENIGFKVRPLTEEEKVTLAQGSDRYLPPYILEPSLEYISIVHFTYYDINEIAREFSIDFSNTLGLESFFYGKPEVVTIIDESGNLSDRVIDLTVLENINDFNPTEIKDYLKQRVQKEKQLAKEKVGYFSEMFASYDVFSQATSFGKKTVTQPKNYIKYSFFFDFLRYMKENAILGKFFDSTDPKILQILLTLTKINYFKLIRIKEKPDVYGNYEEEIISTKLKPNFDFSATINSTNLNETGVSILENLLFFSGKDFSLTEKTYGKYNYKIEIELTDPSYTFIFLWKALITGSIQVLKNYLEIAKLPEISGEVLLDQNPYIDIARENSVGSYKKGFFIANENRFSEDLLTIFSSDSLKALVDNYILVKKSLNEYGKDLKLPDAYYSNLSTSIFSSVNPKIANPETVLEVIRLYESLMYELEAFFNDKKTDKPFIKDSAVPASAILPISNPILPSLQSLRVSIDKQPDFIQTLKIENIFISAKNKEQAETNDKFNFKQNKPVADSELPDCFAFEYVENKNLNSIGLLVAENLPSFDIFLKNIVTPSKDKEIRTTLDELEVQKNLENINITGDLQTTIEYIKAISFSNIDFILSLYGTPSFDVYLNDLLKIPNSINASQIVKRLLSVYDLFNEKNISIQFPEDLTKKFERISSDSQEAKKIEESEKVFNILQVFVCYNIAVGILNNQKLINGKTVFENKINYYTSDANNTSIKINQDSKFFDSKLIKSSEFKLRYETMREVYRISFNKNSDGIINLKDPIYTKVTPFDEIGVYLCSLEQYTNINAFLEKPVYESVPIYNKYFLLNKGTVGFSTIITPVLVTGMITGFTNNLPIAPPAPLLKTQKYDWEWFINNEYEIYFESVLEDYFFDEFTNVGSNQSGDLQSSRSSKDNKIIESMLKKKFIISITADKELFGDDIVEYKLYFNDTINNRWQAVSIIKIIGSDIINVSPYNFEETKISSVKYLGEKNNNSEDISNFLKTQIQISQGDKELGKLTFQNITNEEFGYNYFIFSGSPANDLSKRIVDVFGILYTNYFEQHVERIKTTGHF